LTSTDPGSSIFAAAFSVAFDSITLSSSTFDTMAFGMAATSLAAFLSGTSVKITT
jgi:hypothetical protein